ncbi:alpha/beta hydrolase [Aeoliella sp. ICT_H6.2]|uniref:Alpha/beta hydrolase n=1 Tax=Aeoliella straminimaris TaxID=2954799 RepID=A0A9X2JHH8_9BACT|nr:alpha/beta hydrolase [Aeoliella straminimaris]MCO6044653.1 alpha/beta hydrolase [Aeoliella straminimaris]
MIRYHCSHLHILVVYVLGFAFSMSNLAKADEPTRELLWPAGAPGAKGDTPSDKPTLTFYLPPPEEATGTAIVVCPGGGYKYLAIDSTGHDIGEWLRSFGVAGIVLEYRMSGTGYMHPAPLQDAQRAIRTVRSRATELEIAPDRIGIIGFSAGGHLAATAGTHFDSGIANSDDPIERMSSRPDFMALCYPVIAFGEPFTHRGSQWNLIGKEAPSELVRSLSAEKQVKPDTPPTFLFHTDEDRGVPAENSVAFYRALRRAKVPTELHIYQKGGHGVGLAHGVPGTSAWPEALKNWLKVQGFLKE